MLLYIIFLYGGHFVVIYSLLYALFAATVMCSFDCAICTTDATGVRVCLHVCRRLGRLCVCVCLATCTRTAVCTFVCVYVRMYECCVLSPIAMSWLASHAALRCMPALLASFFTGIEVCALRSMPMLFIGPTDIPACGANDDGARQETLDANDLLLPCDGSAPQHQQRFLVPSVDLFPSSLQWLPDGALIRMIRQFATADNVDVVVYMVALRVMIFW